MTRPTRDRAPWSVSTVASIRPSRPAKQPYGQQEVAASPAAALSEARDERTAWAAASSVAAAWSAVAVVAHGVQITAALVPAPADVRAQK